MKCPNCGEKITAGNLYCESCGYEIRIVPDFDPEIEQEIESSLSNLTSEEGEEQVETKILFKDKIQKNKHAILIGTAFFVILIFCIVYLSISYINNNSYSYQYNKALESKTDGNYSLAIKYLSRAHEILPLDTSATLMYADCMYEQGEKEQAVSFLLQEIVSVPNVIEYYDKIISWYEDESKIAEITELLNECTSEAIREKYNRYQAPEPEFGVKAGTYYEIISLKLLSNEKGKIYYTLDGSIPTSESEYYVSPIFLEEGEHVINAVFVNDFGISSRIITGTYIVDIAPPYPPEINVYSGIFYSPENIIVEVPDNCKVYYTLDGSIPDNESLLYTGPVVMPLGNTVFKAVTCKGEECSDVTDRVFELIMNTELTADEACGIVLNELIVQGKLQDSTGASKENSGLYEYRCNSAFKDDGQVYYLVTEYYKEGNSKSTRTGNLFGVNVNTEKFTNVTYGDIGQCVIY